MIDYFTDNKKARRVVISFMFLCLVGTSMYAGRSIDYNTGLIEVFLHTLSVSVSAIFLHLFIAFDAVVSVSDDEKRTLSK